MLTNREKVLVVATKISSQVLNSDEELSFEEAQDLCAEGIYGVLVELGLEGMYVETIDDLNNFDEEFLELVKIAHKQIKRSKYDKVQ